MATRIESGQMQLRGAGSAPIQQLDVRPVQPIGFQVAAQSQSQMGQLIQRMSEGLFKEAGRLAEQEGLRYAAENPLTAEEIELAKAGAITEPTGRIFDDAFRRARTIQLSSHFETEGVNEMMRLLPEIEANRMSSEQVITKLREMNSGYTAALSKLDPGAAMKFNAAMAATGNTIVRKALDTEVKNAKEQARIKFDVYADKIAQLLEPTIEQNPEQAEALINMHRVNTSNQALALGDVGLQREYSQRFETQQRNAKIAVVTKALTSDENLADPIMTLDAIKRGEIGRLSPVLKNMIRTDFDSVAKVQANYLAAVAQRQTTIEMERKNDNRKAVQAAIPLYSQIIQMGQDDPNRAALVKGLQDIAQANPDAVPWSVITSIAKPPKEGNLQTEFNTRVLIDSGRISNPQDIWSLTEGPRGISEQQALSLYNYMTSADKRTEREENTMMARLAGIPTVPGQVVSLDPKGEEFKRLNGLRAQAAMFKAEANIRGEPLSSAQLESQLTKWLEGKRNTETVRVLRDRLQVYEKKAGGSISLDSLTTVEKSGKLNQSELVVVRRLLQQIRDAEGLQ